VKEWLQLLLETRHLGAGTILLDLDPLEPTPELAAGDDGGPHPLGGLVRLLLALPQELPGAIHAFGRVGLGEVPAFVAHLRRHLQDFRLKPPEVGMPAEILEAFTHAVELALQSEAAVPVGGMRRLVGLRHVPHRHLEGSVRILETHHPVVHRHEEAESGKEQRQAELNGNASVDRGVAEADIEPEPREKADRCGEAPDSAGKRKGQDGYQCRALHDDL
jgi:hypothetical protein